MAERDLYFKMTNARVTRFKELDRVAFLTVIVNGSRGPTYMDVKTFQPAPFPIEEGLAVTIWGEPQMSKRGDKWEMSLVAKAFERGDDNSAPRSKRSGERQNRPNPHADAGMGEDTVDW